MKEGFITCPQCGYEFELSDALTGKIREHLKAELQQEISLRELDLKKKTEALKEKENEITKTKEELEERIQTGIKDRLKDIEEKTAKKVEGKYADQVKEQQEIIEQQEKSIKEFRQKEIELRRKQRELEEAKQEAELAIARKLDEERAKIQEAAAKKAAEEHRLKDLEKDKIINDLKASLEDMKRKAEQGSMETQGEVLEQDLEVQLRAFFPHDDIRPVPKGVPGADIIQCVRTPFGHDCGTLLWETKNTKNWSANWIQKLKDNMITTRATLAILVSVALPENIERFGQMDGIWVSDPLCALPLAAVLREQLIALSRERALSIGKNEKMEALYQYLSGNEFKQKIEGIVEAFTSMQEQLNQERRAMEKHWNQREKQIQRVIKNTAGLYGDMQGIIGGQIPKIAALELDDFTVRQLPPGYTQEESENG
ncbi:MAG: DUF2130 domain-containing protein [candidate division Zixibacteria bacterium]|nr:DUF2130 domain-containing protein [candidate division Zixibacteria bacterium]